MVQAIIFFEKQSLPRFLHLAQRKRSTAAAKQLDIYFRRTELEVRFEYESVVLPLLLSRTARPELAQSEGRSSNVRRRALLVQERHLRLPPRRRRYSLRTHGSERQSSGLRYRRIRLPEPAAHQRQEPPA